jgi:hypothetical protein
MNDDDDDDGDETTRNDWDRGRRPAFLVVVVGAVVRC